MLAVKSGQDAITAALNDKGKNIRDPLADGGGVKVTGISAATHQEVTAYVNPRTYYGNTLGSKVYEEWLFERFLYKNAGNKSWIHFFKRAICEAPFQKPESRLYYQESFYDLSKSAKRNKS